jgi:hypothetical protein
MERSYGSKNTDHIAEGLGDRLHRTVRRFMGFGIASTS